jgi:hypothetical protein
MRTIITSRMERGYRKEEVPKEYEEEEEQVTDL